MFPIRDHNPSGCTPFVTWALIATNVLIFLSYWPVLVTDPQAERFFQAWGLVPAALTEGGVWHGVLTSMFLHGGWMHLLGNMLFLWIFGDNLEDQMGHAGFLGFYLAVGVAAALAQVAADPGSVIPMVGASGAIGGVMGGYLLLFPRARVDVLVIIVVLIRVFAVPAWAMLGLWFAIQIVSGLATPIDMGGVAYWAHAGGFAAGVALAWPLWRRRGAQDFWTRTAGRPDHPPAIYSASRVPTVKRRRR